MAEKIEESNVMSISGGIILVIFIVTVVFIFLTTGGFNVISFLASCSNSLNCLLLLTLIWAFKPENINSGSSAVTLSVIIILCLLSNMSSWIGAYLSGVKSITPTTPASTSSSTPTQ